VPVHDGVVLTESSDIIDYLDRHFPNPPLRPSDPDRTRTLVSLVKALGRNPDLAEDPVSQYDLKGRAAGMRAQMGKLEALVKNDELVEFIQAPDLNSLTSTTRAEHNRRFSEDQESTK
jgi:glutathione S-transferase